MSRQVRQISPAPYEVSSRSPAIVLVPHDAPMTTTFIPPSCSRTSVAIWALPISRCFLRRTISFLSPEIRYFAITVQLFELIAIPPLEIGNLGMPFCNAAAYVVAFRPYFVANSEMHHSKRAIGSVTRKKNQRFFLRSGVCLRAARCP